MDSDVLFLQLVDLKAELYRKQEQFKQAKLGQEHGAGSKSKVTVKVRMGKTQERCLLSRECTSIHALLNTWVAP